MEFRARERGKSIIDKSKRKAKIQAKIGTGDKGRDEVREWGGIGIKKVRDKKVVVEEAGVKEEARGDRGVSLAMATAAAVTVVVDKTTRRRTRMRTRSKNKKNRRKKSGERRRRNKPR